MSGSSYRVAMPPRLHSSAASGSPGLRDVHGEPAGVARVCAFWAVKQCSVSRFLGLDAMLAAPQELVNFAPSYTFDLFLTIPWIVFGKAVNRFYNIRNFHISF